MNGNGRRIMIVSRSFKADDFFTHVQQIISLAEQHQIETIIFPGWSYDHKRPPLTYEKVFENSKYLKHLLIETANVSKESDMQALFFCRDNKLPLMIHQKFGRSSDHRQKKEEFINELQERITDDTACIICGEIGTLIYSRKEGAMRDEFELNKMLNNYNVKIILNYFHTFSKRYEINKKRQHLSLNGRTLISVWNHDYVERESKIPWCVFSNGKNKTHDVQELSIPFNDRPDIRVGIYQVEG